MNYFICTSVVYVWNWSGQHVFEQYGVESFVFLPAEVTVCFDLLSSGSRYITESCLEAAAAHTMTLFPPTAGL